MTDLPLPERDGADVELVRSVPADTSGFSATTRARLRAVDVLFEADLRGADTAEIAESRTQRSTAQTTLPERARAFADLYARHRADVDDALHTHSEAWQLSRMPAVDRAILRLGTAEILFSEQDTPPAIIIREYVRIAEQISTEKSPAFVNALLQRIADMKELLG
ncbi:transcription antitermination factor NusB [Helcobacillus massiliensis]|uniref:transcription antitermination factor NusB n=1 Tax=Helcobacillus massiliensis TaxID=521392 RepID=UPI0021A54983|nr:transcription antitermination factor NusB [Helcobacillus massiliensis]MCT1556961.1 transcription antitermination factor NusB [Helcobacillus massiliensis]MCT2035350.1 transcription antitermination factor NusB [Helcobacillus massiliensis]MCT2331435.1 transcription antitermination factor NusB [Helcobacillus massiliensis]MDK7741031.1 transcription antitermination factor NusB [Helcobacillus massiliensis]WOO93843.1 transcription antitermination factor NusB [Helcobacillus massiliensis]